MKKIKILVIVFSAILLFTACQKEDTIKNYDSISGVLSPGENILAEDMEGIEIYLGRFHNSVDFADISFKTSAIDSVAATSIAADGSFAFTGLTPGYYGVALEEGYIFSADTAIALHIDGANQNQLYKTIERSSLENIIVVIPPPLGYQNPDLVNVYLEKDGLSSRYHINKTNFFLNSKLGEIYPVQAFNEPSIIVHNTISRSDDTYEYLMNNYNQDIKIQFEILKFNEAGKVSDTIYSPMIHYPWDFKTDSYEFSPLKIELDTAYEMGYWFWKEEKPDRFVFSEIE